jgi:hypothetical protein
MLLPELDKEGYLPPGLYGASLTEILQRFGVGSAQREQQAELLRLLVEAAKQYSSIKRGLVWGSFRTSKPEPNDLDCSLVVSTLHRQIPIAAEHQRFLVPAIARQHYGLDTGYLVIYDYPLEKYIEQVDFLCQTRRGRPRGILEISLRGEKGENTP